jgi:hypothetical protein
MVQANLQMLPSESHAHVPFFRRRWVQTILPMGTSLAVHLGIAILGYSVYRVATVYTTHTITPPHEITSDIDAVTPAKTTVTSLGTIGVGQKPEDRLGNIESIEAESPKFDPSKSRVFSTTLGGEKNDAADQMIGFGPGNTTRGQIGLDIGGTGEVGNVRIGRPKATDDVGGTGPLPTHIVSKKVIFVCDATGSMNSIFGGLRDVLHDRISKLEIGQAFNVVFFSDNKVLNLNPPGLMLATDDNKTKAYHFLGDVSPRGLTNPIPAIRAAFAQQPDAMYVLTDGFDQVDSLESVYNEFATLNKAGHVQVHTILVGSGEQKDLVEILQRIAKDNRGTMRVVSKDAF